MCAISPMEERIHVFKGRTQQHLTKSYQSVSIKFTEMYIRKSYEIVTPVNLIWAPACFHKNTEWYLSRKQYQYSVPAAITNTQPCFKFSLVKGGTHVQPYLCHKLWQTTSGDLRLFWLLQSRTAPAVPPEPPCLLLHLLLLHLHRHHPLPLSSRCCPCQHSPPHPSCRETHTHTYTDIIASRSRLHYIIDMKNNKRGLAHWQHLLLRCWRHHTSSHLFFNVLVSPPWFIYMPSL